MPLTSNTMAQCPCGSGQLFTVCCQPFINGTQNPLLAEQLMRSRYSAFVTGALAYIINTTAPKQRASIDADELQTHLKQTQWVNLSIVHTEQGQPEDIKGIVAFKATFITRQEYGVMHEVSHFIKQDNRWFYVDGEVKVEPLIQSP